MEILKNIPSNVELVNINFLCENVNYDCDVFYNNVKIASCIFTCTKNLQNCKSMLNDDIYKENTHIGKIEKYHYVISNIEQWVDDYYNYFVGNKGNVTLEDYFKW